MTEIEPQYLYLTTTGRRSGMPREIEIWFTQTDARFYLLAEYETANWVENIRANAAVRVRVGERQFEANGRIIDAEPELRAQVKELFRKKYGWGDGLVVELTPVNE